MQDLQVLQDAARRRMWRSRGCKYPTLPCTLAKILPETTVLAQFGQIENASPTKNTFLTFSTNTLCPCMYTPGDSSGASSGLGLGAKTLRGQLYHTRNSVHYSCPRFWYPVYWMCIEYKDCVYNCWEINVWSLLLTFKCCKMLPEDGEAWRRRNKRELVDARPSNAARCC